MARAVCRSSYRINIKFIYLACATGIHYHRGTGCMADSYRIIENILFITHAMGLFQNPFGDVFPRFSLFHIRFIYLACATCIDYLRGTGCMADSYRIIENILFITHAMGLF